MSTSYERCHEYILIKYLFYSYLLIICTLGEINTKYNYYAFSLLSSSFRTGNVLCKSEMLSKLINIYQQYNI